MLNLKLDKREVVFFDSIKTPLTEAKTSSSMLNEGYDSLILEITKASTISAKVQGCIQDKNADGTKKADEDCEWTDLGIINMTSLGTTSAISAKGIYTIAISGITRYRVVVDSVDEATIVGVVGM